ncbi:MAG: hypothetical protein H6742_14935 [Alphaproteobacteria bacterium]|nr:hypothetical protein [Alphaproteobacteria bacterium]
MAPRRWKRPHPVQLLLAAAVGLALLAWIRGLLDPPERSHGGDGGRGGPLVAPP